ncbi:tRNA (adenosine(37)-N6)-dimethylallyltransferase MiaA [Brevibacterium jeotgali]|uniref:tRNA dimethylallyltransferase n=1 Tax=Brevibacterium jeotgali TaxID=1262550 RepID=A0A2H1L3H1_9MICO|nr:tRNA (adenosine(37)-N6)-dimethylallyltransferase MiaA [Brevibacterium jeotgali]TWC02548.1 tRNA dimethylallyltransferase [Brevibacterium jeotgali]SMY11340.1 tRNA dimethylallyltransferase [Brevibacterium jeotgali]
MKRPLVTVVGPTATGKSDLAIALCRRMGGEIVNGDALQLYRGMDIGTAKLPLEERGGITHHLVDVLDIAEESSVSGFQHLARRAIEDIEARSRRPVLVGGSGLYVRAVTDDIRFPGTDPGVRARLEAEAESQGAASLHSRLRALDPPAADKIAPGDTRRIVRALEVIEITGSPFTAHLPDYTYVRPTVQIGLVLDRGVLHRRIEDRVHRMWDAGWVDEVVGLRSAGLHASSTAGQAIGYAEIMAHLDGTMTREDAIDRTIIRTRQFAKRQETWFRRDPRIHLLSADSPDLVERALSLTP